MFGRVIVVNPNSSERVSMEIGAAVRPIAEDMRVEVEVVTSPGGPPAIESDDDVAASIQPMIETVMRNPADAYVVACFSDPGIDEMRDRLDPPVFGIAESAVLAAMSRGRRVGIISAVEEALPRHHRYWTRIGVAGRVVKDVATGRGVLDLESEESYHDVLETGRVLVGAGADVVVLGCTGMTHLRDRLQRDLAMPVVEPCQAAVRFAALTLRDSVNEKGPCQ